MDSQLQQLKRQQSDLNGQWEAERADMVKLQSTKEEIERVNLEVQAAERDYDLNRAAELKYGTMMELQKALNQAEQALAAKVGWCCQPGLAACRCEGVEGCDVQHHAGNLS